MYCITSKNNFMFVCLRKSRPKMTISYQQVGLSKSLASTRSTILPYTNSGREMSDKLTDNDLSKLPLMVVFICFCFDIFGFAPGSKLTPLLNHCSCAPRIYNQVQYLVALFLSSIHCFLESVQRLFHHWILSSLHCPLPEYRCNRHCIIIVFLFEDIISIVSFIVYIVHYSFIIFRRK